MYASLDCKLMSNIAHVCTQCQAHSGVSSSNIDFISIATKLGKNKATHTEIRFPTMWEQKDGREYASPASSCSWKLVHHGLTLWAIFEINFLCKITGKYSLLWKLSAHSAAFNIGLAQPHKNRVGSKHEMTITVKSKQGLVVSRQTTAVCFHQVKMKCLHLVGRKQMFIFEKWSLRFFIYPFAQCIW